METAVESRGDVTVVRITGSVDGTTAEQLGRVFTAQLAAGRNRLVAALDAVDYTSSAGLRVLLGTVKEARSRGGDLRLAGPRKDVLKVLDLSGFTGILKVYADLESAVAGFGA
jgi:anti-sigma B factor antagonist